MEEGRGRGKGSMRDWQDKSTGHACLGSMLRELGVASAMHKAMPEAMPTDMIKAMQTRTARLARAHS